MAASLTFLYYASDSFASRAQVLRDSINKFYPDAMISHIKPETNISIGSYIPGMAKERLIAALTLLDQYDRVILIGADCEIKSRMYELHAEFAKNDVVIVPHAISPVASRDYMAQIYRTGHANADLIAFKNTENSRNILKWLISVTEGDELKTKGIF